MTMDARIFYVILTINTIAAISYEVWNETHWRENPGARTGGRIRTGIIGKKPVMVSHVRDDRIQFFFYICRKIVHNINVPP